MSGGTRDPATTTVQMAEQALLGALLWDPSRVREVMGWLTPDDFWRPAHGDIYTVLVHLTRAGAAADPLTVTKVLANGRYHDGPAHHAAAYLHTLLSFTPATPNPARDRGPITFYSGPNISHHVAYARLVLEASVRRQLRGAGVRIGQHAREAVQRAAAEKPGYATVAASAERLQPVLDLIERQLELLTGRLPSAPARPAQHPATRSATVADGASGFAKAVRADRFAVRTVRTMSSKEWAAAAQHRACGEGTERSVLPSHGSHGWVTVWVGPVAGNRVGLLATAGADPHRPPAVSASVSCATYDTALRLADELLAGGPQTVDRLQRAAAAAHELVRAEYRVIGGCLISPVLREVATSVLRAEDFTDPAAAATWTAIATLQHSGDPLDFVLVSAHLDRQTAAADAARLSPSELAAFACRADYPTGCWGLTTVAREALHRAVDTAHHELLTAAADNSRPAEQVIRRAQAVLARAQTTARRLRGDTPHGAVDATAAAHVAGTREPGTDTTPATGAASRRAPTPPGRTVVRPCATTHPTPPPRRPRPHR